MWEVMWWDAHGDIGWWMIFAGTVWSIFWATLLYLVVSAFSRLAQGLKSARIL